MRKIAIAAISMATILLVPTSAADAKTKRTSCNNAKLVYNYSINYFAVRKLHGRRAPGRNIRKWGLSNSRKSKCRHIRKSLHTLRRMRFPGTRLLRARKPYIPPAQTRTLRAPAGGALSNIAACESGGNPHAVSPSGQYRGKYQFDYQTWGSVGGSGDPAAASEAEQDKRAAMLMAQRGSSPWPVCGG